MVAQKTVIRSIQKTAFNLAIIFLYSFDALKTTSFEVSFNLGIKKKSGKCEERRMKVSGWSPLTVINQKCCTQQILHQNKCAKESAAFVLILCTYCILEFPCQKLINLSSSEVLWPASLAYMPPSVVFFHTP